MNGYVNCDKCKQPIKEDQPCYQTRLGVFVVDNLDSYVDTDGSTKVSYTLDFNADEDTGYEHVECPAEKCIHRETTKPTMDEIVNSKVCKEQILPHAFVDNIDSVKHGNNTISVIISNDAGLKKTWTFKKCMECNEILGDLNVQ